MSRGTSCKCQVCNRRFLYGDSQSPMLKDTIWKRIINYYNLRQYEKESEMRFLTYYRRGAKHKDDQHLYICYVCMEKALNRKIRRSDLIGKDVPLNADFEEMYFNR